MIQGVLTPAERLHIAREIVPMIDRGMRWAGLYFKVRGSFNRRELPR